MTYFMSGSKELLAAWKQVRSTLSIDKSDIEHLNIVNTFWMKAPISASLMIDWDDPVHWPTPWELMSLTEFDESAIALGMFYTLILSDDLRWNASRLKLVLVRDTIRLVQKIILEVDNRWVMNLDYNDIRSKNVEKDNCIVQQEYEYNGKVHLIKNLELRIKNKN